MSLFSTIQNSANALKVSELGLHVTGNNISNANTPGYIRQELLQTSGPSVRLGNITLGYGVQAEGVVQKIDNFLVERMRQTQSDVSSAEAVGDVYSQLESIFGELSDTDLSSQLNEFSSSISDMINQPGNEALRRLVLERGRTLTGNIRTISTRMNEIAGNLNTEVQGISNKINQLTKQLANLNRNIVEMEGGRTSGSDAVGLRDERLRVLNELSQLVDIRAVEQPSGSVTAYVGGEYLVADGIDRPVKYAVKTVDGKSYPEVRLADTDFALQVNGGRLHGIYQARDGAVGEILSGLDRFASDIVEQFNLIHSQGQGLEGYSDVTSHLGTDDPTGPLDLAGYPTKIQNGQFEIQVLDLQTGLSTTHTIRVELSGGTNDSSLEDIRAQIDAVSGLNSSITPDGRLRIEASNHLLQFSFQNDSSKLLAATGINTFFVGNSASTIDISESLTKNPKLLATSLTGVGSGTDNGLKLAQAFEDPIAALGGISLKQAYEQIVVRTAEAVNVQSGKTEGLKNFFATLEAKHLGISGVNLDEEAVKMIMYQRVFQANSRLIQASSELLETLVNL